MSDIKKHADELNTALLEIANGRRKPAKIPLEPMIKLIEFANSDLQEKLALSQLREVQLCKDLENLRSDLFLLIESKHGAKAASEYPSIVKAVAILSTPTTRADLDAYADAQLEEVGLQRNSPTSGWVPMNVDDMPHYTSQHQEIRTVYVKKGNHETK